MENKVETKSQLLTIPNLISLFRVILIPFIVWSYFALKQPYVDCLIYLIVITITIFLIGRFSRVVGFLKANSLSVLTT